VPFDRESLLARFKEHHIDGRVFFWPLSRLPMFEEVVENLVSYDLYKRAMNLPSYPELSSEDQERVCSVVRLSLERVSHD
ncbi:MAG: glutamine--scyllo-inositol aminotransferase, partial [Methanobacteriota archaeon]